MQICPFLFVRKFSVCQGASSVGSGRGVDCQESRKKTEAFVTVLGEEKTVCIGKLTPLLNPLESVMINKHGASGTGVDEVPVCFWHG